MGAETVEQAGGGVGPHAVVAGDGVGPHAAVAGDGVVVLVVLIVVVVDWTGGNSNLE